MKQIPTSLLTLVAGVLIALISLWVGQNHHLLPEQASVQATLVDNFFNVMVTIATALFIVVQGAIVWFAIRFRRRKGDDTDGLPLEGNVPLEIFWTVIPAIIVIWLGAYSVEVYTQMGGFSPTGHGAGMMMAHHTGSSHRSAPGEAIAAPLLTTDAASELPTGVIAEGADASQYGIGPSPQEAGQAADVSVNVTGLQYAWLFNYPKDGITSGELHIPVGQDVQLNISANDVIHSFWVPQFRLKQDAIPGQPAELRFTATKTGTFPVVCAELCGSYHGSMRTTVIVHTPEAYAQWLTDNRIAQATYNPSVIALTPDPDASLARPVQSWGITADAIAQLHPHKG
ncbi:MAG: cytochrome c oxidase subunit II [Thermosynechococcaceae cyanobacterium]